MDGGERQTSHCWRAKLQMSKRGGENELYGTGFRVGDISVNIQLIYLNTVGENQKQLQIRIYTCVSIHT